MRRALRTSILSLALCAGCPETPNTIEQPADTGTVCDPGFAYRLGQCFCVDDTACPDPERQYCDAVSGTCRVRKPVVGPDAGPVACVTGAIRCAADNKAVERCANGIWSAVLPCTSGVCMSSATGYFCTVCQPGTTRCKSATEQETCSDTGETWVTQACPVLVGGARCTTTACQLCVPGETRCSGDLTSVETCEPSGLSWRLRYCDYTGQCSAATKACVPPLCMPGDRKCKDGGTMQECTFDGSGWTETVCKSVPGATATAICKASSGSCFDPCGDAARTDSYLGCDYWAAVLQNPVANPDTFKGDTADGTQSTKISEFAIVVSNPNPDPVRVKVTRRYNGAEQVSPMNPAPDAQGYYTVAANALVTLKLPWQQPARTGQNPFAYHLVSEQPISAYQFSPVRSGTSGWNTVYAYTSDASLLLPAHILTKRYVVVGQETTSSKNVDGAWGKYSGLMAVVGTEDATQVTIRFAAHTESSGATSATPVGARAKGDVQTYTLNRYDVLQIVSDLPGTPALECSQTPFYANNTNLAASSRIQEFCRYDADTTGSIVTSDKPIAVFGGSSCTLKPFNRLACDHIEEQMPPFETWGKAYVGVRSRAYRDTYDDDVSTRSPDYWRVVAACGKADCPAGTKVKIDPAPKKLLQPQFCPLGGGDCVLPPVDAASGQATAPVLEFEHEGDFLVTGDQPIILAQYLTSEDANKRSGFDPSKDPPASGDAAEGDPSLILAAPVEQWRRTYHVLASPTMEHNYLNLAVKSATPAILVDGKTLASFQTQKSTAPGGYTVYRVTVGQGQHKIESPDPVGVTVYGYDKYVSYGYTGGLDLQRITTIVPGG